MNRMVIESAIKQMNDVFQENLWHAALSQLLTATSAEQACWRPAEGGHTIYEIVMHLAYSAEEMARRCEGKQREWDEARSWVETPAALSEEAWISTIESLIDSRKRFAEALTEMNDDSLNQVVYEKFRFIDTILHVIHHDAYHAGQIAYIRRLQGQGALM